MGKMTAATTRRIFVVLQRRIGLSGTPAMAAVYWMAFVRVVRILSLAQARQKLLTGLSQMRRWGSTWAGPQGAPPQRVPQRPRHTHERAAPKRAARLFPDSQERSAVKVRPSASSARQDAEERLNVGVRA
jgi:hypothetical protein